eukprot:6187399-Pleurochrysis_carterae.AAC.1
MRVPLQAWMLPGVAACCTLSSCGSWDGPNVSPNDASPYARLSTYQQCVRACVRWSLPRFALTP